MFCRIGSTSRSVHTRHQELISEGKVPKHSTVQTITRGLTYGQAKSREKSEITNCKNSGKGCHGALGGMKKPGNVYKVYQIDWQ